MRSSTLTVEKRRPNKRNQIVCTPVSQAPAQDVSPYNQVLPADDPAWMRPLRTLERRFGFQTPVIYSSVIGISVFHAVFAWWAMSSILGDVWPMWQTIAFGFLMGGVAGFGVTAGVHRYWCHRSYKARRPLQVILLACFSVAGQNNVLNWVRDHHVHHKYSETSADPHDSRRGLFFSHVGWLMLRKHPEVLRRGKQLDLSDITGDPLLRWHARHFNKLKLALCFVLPSLVPLYWGESWWYAVGSQALMRYCISLHCTWSVNSFAHMFGNKPYDRTIRPSENWCVSIVAMGEGWHNYHHAFPWDYKAAELPYMINLTTVWLEVFRAIGWVYDVKQASTELVKTTAKNRGGHSAADIIAQFANDVAFCN